MTSPPTILHQGDYATEHPRDWREIERARAMLREATGKEPPAHAVRKLAKELRG